MTREPLEQSITMVEQRINELEKELETLRSGLSALKIIAGSEGSSSTVTQLVEDADKAKRLAREGPRGKEAVRQVLEENLGQWVSLMKIADTLTERGWLQSRNPREAVRTTASRLLTDEPNLIEKQGSEYRLRREPLADQTASAEAAEGGDGRSDDLALTQP